MLVNNSLAQEILSWINDEGHFKEMTLTPAGEFFVDPAKITKADAFWMYYKSAIYLPGSLYVSSDNEFCAFGDQLKRNLSIPLLKNKTEIGLYQDGACCIRSRNAGVPNGCSLLTFFRYRSKVVFIVAGDVVKHRSWTLIMEVTAENNALLAYAFTKYLRRTDAKLSAHLADSNVALKVDQQLIPDAAMSCI